jgi:predicted Ser/Thr protein kinase
MNNLEYNFYPPNNPQFYFQSNGFKQLKKFYKPYSLKSKVFWFIYCNSIFIRNKFSVKGSQIPLPINHIKQILNPEKSVVFLNLGTSGEEQKATIIALNEKQNLFLKYANSELAITLVENEATTLKNLELKKICSAKLLNFEKGNNYAFLLTEVINGNKFTQTKLNEKLMTLLLDVNNCFPSVNNNLIQVFSHGDFCPWNLLITNDQKLVLIDWEKSEFKTLGYDLFTFIFQTSFLLNPKDSVSKIINNNKSFIDYYFNSFNVKNWGLYLNTFAKTKVEEELIKNPSNLRNQYKKLLNYTDEN